MPQVLGPPIKDGLKNYLTLPEERLIFAIRKHWFVLAMPVFFTFILALAFISGSTFLFSTLFPSPTLVTITLLTTGLLTSTLLVKIFVDWYCHLYLVTTHKILEVSHTPMSSHVVNGVLLDQVRATEVDVNCNGILCELLDMGSVTITFDRPTHQEEFLFADIKDPDSAGITLANALDGLKREASSSFWFHQKQKQKKFFFSEDIFVPNGLEGGVV